VPEPLADLAIPTVTFPGTDLVTTTLGFGCAGLYAEPSRAQRTRVLEAAYDAGVRHFDTAPMYGLGLAERDLGRFARSRRDQVVIATKFGIAPRLALWPLAHAQGPFRRLLRASPALKRRALKSAKGPSSGRAGSLLYRTTGFDAAAARAGLEHSLRELDTDYIDLLLLHDPEPGSVGSDDASGFLDDARRSGKIRAWGIAGEAASSIAVAATLPVRPPVLQIRDDILASSGLRSNAAPDQGRITFGVLGATSEIVSYVGADPARSRRWHEVVGVNCTDAEVVAGLLLGAAARRNPAGVVLFTTTRMSHARSSAEAPRAAADGDRDLDAFMALLGAELCRHLPNRGAQG
jgi:D-threo-aldose 1-dehydrogenase